MELLWDQISDWFYFLRCIIFNQKSKIQCHHDFKSQSLAQSGIRSQIGFNFSLLDLGRQRWKWMCRTLPLLGLFKRLRKHCFWRQFEWGSKYSTCLKNRSSVSSATAGKTVWVIFCFVFPSPKSHIKRCELTLCHCVTIWVMFIHTYPAWIIDN